jgi:hypothetical protein
MTRFSQKNMTHLYQNRYVANKPSARHLTQAKNKITKSTYKKCLTQAQTYGRHIWGKVQKSS